MEATSSSVILTLIYQSTWFHTTEDWSQVYNTEIDFRKENSHADWKEMAKYNKIIDFCFRGNKLQSSNYGVHKPLKDILFIEEQKINKYGTGIAIYNMAIKTNA